MILKSENRLENSDSIASITSLKWTKLTSTPGKSSTCCLSRLKCFSTPLPSWELQCFNLAWKDSTSWIMPTTSFSLPCNCVFTSFSFCVKSVRKARDANQLPSERHWTLSPLVFRNSLICGRSSQNRSKAAPLLSHLTSVCSSKSVLRCFSCSCISLNSLRCKGWARMLLIILITFFITESKLSSFAHNACWCIIQW